MQIQEEEIYSPATEGLGISRESYGHPKWKFSTKTIQLTIKSVHYRDSRHILNLGTTQGALEDFKHSIPSAEHV